MDLFDYIRWRGDLTFEASPLNSVDAIILCQLSYLNFNGLVSEDFSVEKQITLGEAAPLFSSSNFEERKKIGLMINPKTVDLLFECSKSVRFGSLKVCGFIDKYSQKLEEQFSAITFVSLNPAFAFTAFRGTDDTLTGWKEDFNLAFKSELPSQLDATKYLTEAVDFFGDGFNLYCGGHSKGGNLAVYSAAEVFKKQGKELSCIYNFDGPGFTKETLLSPSYQAVLSRTKSYFPQGSIVGMLFEHDSNYSVLKSDGFLTMQHDPFNWHTQSLDFELCEELEKSSIYFNNTMNEWFVKMPSEKRQELVETLFSVLEAANVETTTQLAEHWVKNSGLMIKAIAELDKDIRSSALDSAHQFVKLLAHNFPDMLTS